MEASRPTTRPAASMTTHFFSTSAGLAEYVRMGLSLVPSSFRGAHMRRRCLKRSGLIHQPALPGQRLLFGVIQQNHIVIKMVFFYLDVERAPFPKTARNSRLARSSVRRRVAERPRPARFT